MRLWHPFPSGGTPELPAKSFIAAGETLPYDDGERIMLPERFAGCFCVLVDGQLTEIVPVDKFGQVQCNHPDKEELK